MVCKHSYYNYQKGVLVCTQCGEPSANTSTTIEDKSVTTHEDKSGKKAPARKVKVKK